MNILVITSWSYREGLIQAYTLPYIRIFKRYLPATSTVYLMTMEKENSVWHETQPNKVREELLKENIVWLRFRHKPFAFSSVLSWFGIILRLAVVDYRKKISTVHCWGTPAGAIGYFLSKIKQTRLIVDSYEPHAEAMVENGTWQRSSLSFRILFRLEARQTRRADVIIATTSGMREYALQNFGLTIANFFVKPACVATDTFAQTQRKNFELVERYNLKDKLVGVYAGKLGGIYLKAEVFEMLKCAYDYWGERFRALLLVDLPREEIESLCNAANLPTHVVISTSVPFAQIPVWLGLADFALTPVKPVPTKRFCTPIKDGEYWASGLPVIIPAGISDDADIIENNNIGYVLHHLNSKEYTEAMHHIDGLLKKPSELATKIKSIAEEFRGFRIADEVYRKVYVQER